MNPTDQARKEARRRELRKNKKQRSLVRQAVIKTKDPRQMLAELDSLDEMELNPLENLPYNDKVNISGRGFIYLWSSELYLCICGGWARLMLLITVILSPLLYHNEYAQLSLYKGK